MLTQYRPESLQMTSEVTVNLHAHFLKTNLCNAADQVVLGFVFVFCCQSVMPSVGREQQCGCLKSSDGSLQCDEQSSPHIDQWMRG